MSPLPETFQSILSVGPRKRTQQLPNMKQSCDHSVATLGKQKAMKKINENIVIITGLDVYTQVLCDILLYLVLFHVSLSKYLPDYLIKIKKTLWSESASELYRPSDRRLSAK
jgi:hypothetical protein